MNNDWRQDLDAEDLGKIEILDAYMQTRSQLPGKGAAGNALVEEDKSTQDIVDDLRDMTVLDFQTVENYMRQEGFGLTTQEDGTVKWAVWRDVLHGIG